VVAAHDRHVPAHADAVTGQRTRQAVRALLQLREGERPLLVDHGGIVRVQLSGRGVAARAARAPTGERAQRAAVAIRPRRAHEAGACQGAGGVNPVPE